ncbi:hypothetical protein BVG79_01114 [Ketogulonicigenium robustum]|uniref:Uncharacterized protein n=1 Tax=Ketogulonicigenium robustum TaxID=92947 RepID=A0A1W6NZE5_9RHOB|nr:hypothetical protein BVG79_01114 [Ketogulonicigenium robustum]
MKLRADARASSFILRKFKRPALAVVLAFVVLVVLLWLAARWVFGG